MNKVDFVKKIAEKAEVTQKEAMNFLAVFDEVMIEDIFAKEDSIRLGIGTFSGYTKVSEARRGRNPHTGEEIAIPKKVISGYPKFKPSKRAKE